MARPLGSDLRRRVVDAIEGGLSTRKAVKQFSVGISTAGSWHRHWRGTGSYEAQKQGKPPGSILDAHEAYLMGFIEERTDITLERIPEKCVRFSDKDTRKSKGLSVLKDFVFVQNALTEMVDRLEAERSLRVDPSTIWYFH